ncbi:hypothetical protein CLV80_11621 [Yoonia maritima]|uniref:Uncharacterized protein n=1 Tax=Yoonia maritima TaxID=1435347 RepID=A0A2T0VTT5_9RHOB|nr:hypothetical protein [Yoonia maritima]PRY74639.1 hypothetical protein CLV80_11621 [Yoonia maritima]
MDPEFYCEQSRDYAQAKHSFPMMGWITYLSQECIDDYALDMDRIRAVAQKVEEVGPTKSAGMLFRIQFHEGRDDWQETLPAITQMCLEADQHRYKLGEYRERPPEERSVDGWHTWLLPDEWWKS